MIGIDSSKLLEIKKVTKIEEINNKCKQEIEAGFVSSALGSEHIYQSEPVDQINLISVVLAGQDSPFKCGIKDDGGNIVWSYKQHTIDQLKQVLADGKAYKLALLEKANKLKEQVKNAKTVDETNKINWD